MPGTLGSFPKLRWKLEAQDKVYVCMWEGVHFYDCIPSQTFNGELCLTISILQTTQWKFGELWPMRVSNLALKMTTWYHTAFLWHQNKPRNFLEGWFGSVTSANWRLLDESGWRETTSHPFQALHKDSGMDHGWGERKSCFSKQWHLVTHQNTHSTYHEKNLWSWTFKSFLKKLFEAPFGLRRQQNINAANVLREQPLSCNGYVPTISMPILLKV